MLKKSSCDLTGEVSLPIVNQEHLYLRLGKGKKVIDEDTIDWNLD